MSIKALKDSQLAFLLNALVALMSLFAVIYTLGIPQIDKGLVAAVAGLAGIIAKQALDNMGAQIQGTKKDPMHDVATNLMYRIDKLIDTLGQEVEVNVNNDGTKVTKGASTIEVDDSNIYKGKQDE